MRPAGVLVGLSMGSLIAVQIAHDRPELVRSAIVMGTCVRKTGFIREWEEAEIAFRRDGGSLPPAFATAHYAMQYYPADALGDDETWERIRPFVAAGFAERDGAMLAAQWQACLDYDSSALLPRIAAPIHAVAFSEDVQTPPRRVREVAELAADGHFHLLQGLGHGSAFGHRPEVVNACLRRSLTPRREDRQRQGEADVPDPGVDDLQDLRSPARLHRRRPPGREPLLGDEPGDRAADRGARARHQVGIDPHGARSGPALSTAAAGPPSETAARGSCAAQR